MGFDGFILCRTHIKNSDQLSLLRNYNYTKSIITHAFTHYIESHSQLISHNPLPPQLGNAGPVGTAVSTGVG